MQKLITLFSFLLLVGCENIPYRQANQAPASDSIYYSEDSIVSNIDSIPLYAKKVIEAYPEFAIRYLIDNRLVFPDGTTILCDDGKKKSFIKMLDDCDIEDMFSMTYDTINPLPSYLNDCGRGRCEALFKKMYGSNKKAAYLFGQAAVSALITAIYLVNPRFALRRPVPDIHLIRSY